MKKLIGPIVCALILSTPAIATAGEAHGCDSVNFGPDVLAKLPNAKVLCRGVTEKNGGVYVHYVGEVVSSSKESTTVDFLDKDNKAIVRGTFKPAPDQTVTMEKKARTYAEMKPGTKLDFYIEHSKWGLYAQPNGKAMTIVSVEQLK